MHQSNILKPYQLSKLVEKFARNRLAQAREMREGSVAKGNRYANQCYAAFRQLREQGNIGRDALVPLLGHEDLELRSTAAAFLLRHKHHDAMRVLNELANNEGMVGFCAQQCIKRWEEGNWQLDLEDETVK